MPSWHRVPRSFNVKSNVLETLKFYLKELGI